jgi:flagellar biosynthesis protein FlhF
MNVQRFTAPTSREAMNKVKAALGGAAVILSTRTTDSGFEVLATTEASLQSLPEATPAAPARAVVMGDEDLLERKRHAALRTRADREAAARTESVAARAARQLPGNGSGLSTSPSSTVAQDTETLAMSTLSFQDYVRERMLRKRREAQLQAEGRQPEVPFQPAAAPQAPVAAQGARSARALADDESMTLAFARTQGANKAAQAAPAVPASALQGRPAAAAPGLAAAPRQAQPPADARLANELVGLKSMIEERFNTLTWLGSSRQDPTQASLMLKLIRSGYSATMARSIIEKLPAGLSGSDAFRWMLEVLARNLRTPKDASALCDEGGVFALVGATGVGKTTTAAKLAAQCVQAYGPNSIGLITLDTYRVAGYEQLRAYGRMLGVVAHLAHDAAALQDLLQLLAGKRMVIIDTAGLGQKDTRIQEMLDLLASPKIKKLLVLNAGSHGDTIDEVLHAYGHTELHGVVLSKTDEAAKLGPALDALIRHQLVLRGVSTGQRVPEDWQRPDAQALVRLSMASAGKSAHDPQSSELGFFFAETGQTPVQLDAWHA